MISELDKEKMGIGVGAGFGASVIEDTNAAPGMVVENNAVAGGV